MKTYVYIISISIVLILSVSTIYEAYADIKVKEPYMCEVEKKTYNAYLKELKSILVESVKHELNNSYKEKKKEYKKIQTCHSLASIHLSESENEKLIIELELYFENLRVANRLDKGYYYTNIFD